MPIAGRCIIPRNASGTASRVTPPGAAGYQPGNVILASEVNGEIADIYTELTNSIDKGGRTTPTANLPMGNFTHTGLRAPAASGETVRFNAFQRGNDVAVAASGVLTLNAEQRYFVLSGTGFNITGFSDAYNGKIVHVRFSDGLTLVHSATFTLPGAFNIITSLNDIGEFVNDSAGIWRCVGYVRALGNPRLKAHRNGVDTSTFASGSSAKVSFTTKTYDPYVLWNTGVGTGTIKEAGHYRIVFQCACATTGISVVASIRKNGAVASSQSSAGAAGISTTARVELTDVFAVNDTFECYAFWVSGTNAMSGDPALSFLSLDKLDV